MLKGLISRLINIIKDIKIPQWVLALFIVVTVFETTSRMLNIFMERVKGIIESWRNPEEERQQQYRIEMPHAFIGVVSVALAAVLLYFRMFKLILVIVAIFASAFYLRYLIMVDGMKQKEAKKAKKMAKSQSTEKPEKADKKRLLRQPESLDEEPEIRKAVYERQRSALSQQDDTDAPAPSMDINSQFKGANAKLRRRLKDKLEEGKGKLKQRKPLKTMFQNLKRSREAGDTTDDGGESEDAEEH